MGRCYFGIVTYLANLALSEYKFQRKFVYYKSAFADFYNELGLSAQRKVEWTLGLVRDLPVIPARYFKSSQGEKGLFEIRIQTESKALRIFCCLNKERGVVLLNGFIKKTKKTPRKEINKALRIKMEYLNEEGNRL